MRETAVKRGACELCFLIALDEGWSEDVPIGIYRDCFDEILCDECYEEEINRGRCEKHDHDLYEP